MIFANAKARTDDLSTTTGFTPFSQKLGREKVSLLTPLKILPVPSGIRGGFSIPVCRKSKKKCLFSSGVMLRCRPAVTQ